MGVSGKLHRVFARIALFAVLLAALAPTISHAVAASSGEKTPWVQICDGVNIKWMQVDADGKPIPRSQAASHFDHCPFCLNHAGEIGVMQNPLLLFALRIERESYPDRFYQSPRPLFIWASAQSRAPPYPI